MKLSVILLNTCSVREKAEVKAYSELGVLKQLKRNNPELIIGIAGCIAQQEGKKLLGKYPQLDMVVGTCALTKVPALLSQIRGRRQKIVCTDMNGAEMYPAGSYFRETADNILCINNAGLENFCSYCIVPFVRGPEQSREMAEIVDEVSMSCRERN